MTQRPVAVIGTGVIGASWAALFLSRGRAVTAWDPAPGAEAALRREVAALWPVVAALDPAPDADTDRLTFAASAEAAVAEAEFVQENGPERLEVKQALFAALDEAAPPDAVLATSSSSLLVSDVQAHCSRPGRVVLGHPFNPPHLIPLVEVVGGRQTAAAALDGAMAFYRSMGKHPILLRRESKGHVANRLQAALWQEAFHLVREGIASVADVDAAIANGPGLRWALLGPFLNLHLSGGAGGMAHNLQHLGPATEAMWRNLGTVQLGPEIDAAVCAGVDDALAGRDLAEVVRTRDALLVDLLRRKAAAGLA